MLARILLQPRTRAASLTRIQPFVYRFSTSAIPKMSAHEGTTLKQEIPKQEQELPGLQKNMEPEPIDTMLETGSGPKPYTGVGKLRGKKALITGGDSGIGRSVAILYAREGADVTIVHLPSEQPDADDTVKAIEREGRKGLSIAFDLENFKHADQVIQKHMDTFGALDILVNNASKQVMQPDFSKIDLDSVESVFRSNILQMFGITKFALPHMSKGASIINTTSVTTFKGSPAMVDYTSTKGAIVGFTRALAANLTPKGIRVNAVAPGPVHTPLQPASRPSEQMEGFGEHSVLGRPGQPSEIAPTYVFLASAEAELYYGQIMHPYPIGDS